MAFHFTRSESAEREAGRFENHLPLGVFRGSVCVNSTIYFDDKPDFMAVKVDDIRPNGMLSAKLCSGHAVSHRRPEQAL
jgi:hypothetical protein